LGKIIFLLSAGPSVDRLNREILRLAQQHRPDVFWADKVLQLQPATVLRCRDLGIQTVCYMIDNAFGPRRDSGLRLYKKAIPCFDLHCTQRDVSVADLKRRGARDVIKIQTAYDRFSHYPPPPGWSDADRNRGVSFIGSPYDDRAQFLSRLAQAGLPVVISGAERAWLRALTPAQFEGMYREGELEADAYREGIWRSKINLSFLTKSNQDEFTHKSFEIYASNPGTTAASACRSPCTSSSKPQLRMRSRARCPIARRRPAFPAPAAAPPVSASTSPTG
jgi:spore maturation protein CgeB